MMIAHQRLMKHKNVTKLWQGTKVSIRDYELEDAIRKGGLRLTHGDQFMELQPEELKNLKPNPNVIQSHYKGSYRLVDITFKPLTEDPRQRKLV
jgi:hypothetical protein